MAHEEIHQRGHVLFPFPQRRKKNGNDGQPVIQVLPKMTLAYRALQVAIRGRDHANVHLDVAHTTDAPDDLVLQHPQELCLKQRRKLSNLIQKQRSLVGHLKQTLLHRLGIGKRAALVAKKFRLHQCFRNRGAIDRHKRFVFSRALIMNCLRHQILAGSTLSLNQNRAGFAGRHFLNKLHQLGHLPRDANHLVIARAPPHFSAQ